MVRPAACVPAAATTNVRGLTAEQTRALLGVGVLARSEVDTRRYRDLVVANPGKYEVLLATTSRADGVPVAIPLQLTPATEQEAEQAISAPATDETMKDTGLLAGAAIATWGVHPLRLRMSFMPATGD
jgi:hypothetical protein